VLTQHPFAIIVIGGGHAGSEAALAAARSGMTTLLISQNLATLAAMPCNPSIGGIAKSHLVFELDALGGEMARNTDASGLQFRVLNTRRGAAVRANRAQCDKYSYHSRMRTVLQQTPGLTLLQDEVVGLLANGDRIHGVACRLHGEIQGRAVILSAGTFLRGTIHIGTHTVCGGGNNEPPANALADQLRGWGFSAARLKTGTPPRLVPESIDFSAMHAQSGDFPPPLFSWDGRRRYREHNRFHVEHSRSEPPADDNWGVSRTHGRPTVSAASAEATDSLSDPIPETFHVEHFSPIWERGGTQTPCFLTQTTARTHQIVRDNLSRSSLYGGMISGTGARYCPSFEDKVVKFPDKETHHVFIEPESATPALNLAYPNGLSCSLPESVQIDMVHSVPGLARAVFSAFAYAIEYDFYDPRDLYASLESKKIHGLFLAGQINGTTGYEEAAALGLMAGINATRWVRDEPPLILGRHEAYIGVMIDDLVTKGTNEPYRMFTSRAERRLLLRQDNARYRLLAVAESLGLADPGMLAESRRQQALIEQEITRLDREKVHGVSLATRLCMPGVDYASLPGAQPFDPEVIHEIELAARYRGYLDREARLAESASEQETLCIPEALDYMSLSTLRYEAREKLQHIRPPNLGMASRIPGVNPADIAMLSIAIRRHNRL